MADQSTSSGNKDKNVERVSSAPKPKLFGSPSRSFSTKQKRSSSFISKIFGRKDSGKQLSKSDEQINTEAADKKEEEKAEKITEVAQPITENTKEGALIQAAKPEDSKSPETNEKKDELKVEPEKPKEELKEKESESMEKTTESSEKIKDVVMVQKDYNPPAMDDRKPIGGDEGIDKDESNVNSEESCQQEDGKKGDNCVSSLALGLQVLCSPRSTK